MVYLANTLITNSYYDANIVSREFETVSGSQMANGVLWLNEILTEKRVDKGMVPYETKFQMPLRPGQQVYWIPDLIAIDTIVFYLQDVRYSMELTDRNQYFGAPRVENIKSLPGQAYFERKVGGGNLHIYFEPDRNYPLEIHGYFDIKIVSQFQDLSANLTSADLGVYQIFPTRVFPDYSILQTSFSLSPGQFVVETTSQSKVIIKDFAGEYPNIGALTNYINSGILPGIRVEISPTNEFILYSDTQPLSPIYVRTNGYTPNGTRFVSKNVAALSFIQYTVIYDNGVNGVGATLTNTIDDTIIADGFALSVGDLVLMTRLFNDYQNGLYVVTNTGGVGIPWVLTRTTNYDQSVEIQVGDLFTIVNGDTYAGLTVVQTSEVSEVGVSPILFSLFNTLTFSNFSTIQMPDYQIFNPLGFDQFFISYLEYALADRLCTKYGYTTPPNVLKQKSNYEAWIDKQSRNIDLTMQKVSTLQQNQRNGINWAQINIGRGWSVS